MILDDDNTILERSLDVPITVRFLKDLHCYISSYDHKVYDPLSSYHVHWKLYYGGRIKTFDTTSYYDEDEPITVRIYAQYYYDENKKPGLKNVGSAKLFGADYVQTIKEFIDVLNADNFYLSEKERIEREYEEFKKRNLTSCTPDNSTL